MLLEFRVSNFRSLREEQVLSLVASKDKTHLSTHCIETGTTAAPYVTRSAVIYGPNASGKSNLVVALGFMRALVEQSAVLIREGQVLNLSAFKLDSELASAPSEFEATFIEQGIRYQYGFTVTRERVMSEWLLAYPGPKAQRWFERRYNNDSGEDEWYFGSFLTGQRQVWQKSTRANALFLSTAVNLNSDQLRPVYHWFVNKLAVLDTNIPIAPDFTMNQIASDSGRSKILQFMNAADLSIADISVDTAKGQRWKVDLKLDEPPSQSFAEQDIRIPKFYHKASDSDQKIEFRFDEESHGTQRLFMLAGPILDVLKKGRVLIVDELNGAMHPLMVRFLVGMFHNPNLNQNDAQLVFTTHDTSLLDVDVFRRDQIWFIEKDSMQASHLYPLTDFHPRKGEALERGYLAGRYGALPFFGELPPDGPVNS